MIVGNSVSPPPPSTMLVKTMIIGPQTNIVNGEGGYFGDFAKVYKLISMIVHKSMGLSHFRPETKVTIC